MHSGCVVLYHPGVEKEAEALMFDEAKERLREIKERFEELRGYL